MDRIEIQIKTKKRIKFDSFTNRTLISAVECCNLSQNKYFWKNYVRTTKHAVLIKAHYLIYINAYDNRL